ncbi:gas vesicle protein GvpG [Streptomyces sp. ICBB 8177]|uniref:gas vesicle protein GvpG n=1 Tax=Streptomyces sp. ICBB 8177 TaxID=563922 RepID=UPI000D67886C|nr:gas vesicle protein GvpG [Streptomyces sp. ICBB 8177]PWI42933.1 gas vesicle protein [Streptomyces sp. ICBB 8177]
MGLITQILTLPLAPARGSAWVIQQVVRTAEAECYDPAPVRAQLAALEQDLLDGNIDEEEFDRREDELLDRLEWLEAEYARLRGPGQAP